MAHTLITPREIAVPTLALLKNKLGITRSMKKQYQSEFTKKTANGGIISIKLPPQFKTGRGWVVDPQDARWGYTDMVLDEPYNIATTISHRDMVLNHKDFAREVSMPIMTRIAQDIEKDMAKLAKRINNQVGTPGLITGGSMTIDQGKQILSKVTPRMANMSADLDQTFKGLITPGMQANLAASFSGMFNPQSAAGSMFTSGEIGTAFGVSWSVSQSLANHTNGTQVTSGGGRPTTGGSAQAGTWVSKFDTTFSLSVAALGGTITEGSVINIDGIFAVNPGTRETTLELMDFVVRSNAAQSATVLDIWPIPIFDGEFQNVTSASNGIPANTGITIHGTANQTYPVAFVIDKDCMTFASVPLPEVEGSGESYVASDPDAGLSVRVWIANEWRTSQKGIRYDVMIGSLVTRPNLGVRIAG